MQNPPQRSGLWLKIYLDEMTNIHQPRFIHFLFVLVLGIHKLVPRFCFFQERSAKGKSQKHPYPETIKKGSHLS
jgi:hypothetical protein